MTLSRNTLFTAQQIKEGEQKIASDLNIDLYELMEKAGKAVVEHLMVEVDISKAIHVYCGTGNNGGDGYVVARLAAEIGYSVTLVQLGSKEKLTNDAKRAYTNWINRGGSVMSHDTSRINKGDVVIDAILGSGFTGELNVEYNKVINDLNKSSLKIISVDLPSGLYSDTGSISSECIQASSTVCFIGLKRGLYTGVAARYVGKIIFADLAVAERLLEQNDNNCFVLDQAAITGKLKSRIQTIHKGDNGRTLCLGGDRGMFGAIRLTAEACCRVGAGLTRVVTQPENVSAIVSARPELMVFDWKGNSNEINQHLEWCDVIALGPGLGGTSWGRSLVGYSRTVEKPIVLDADALAILAKTPEFNNRRVMTPHPGEAAKLLNCSIGQIETDRFGSAKLLQLKYGGVVVLKGSGTIVYNGQNYWVCAAGNPGMSSGGMGDVLTGVIAGLIAQGYSLVESACIGVWVHSAAADLCAEEQGEIGMLATDLFPKIRKLINNL